MRYKLLDMPWNIDEQCEMLPFPFVEWSWLIQYRVGYKPVRPDLGRLLKWVPYYEDGYYDAALLHIDLDSTDQSRDSSARHQVYKELNTVINGIPKIVIVHGRRLDVNEHPVQEVRDLLGGNLVMVSSEAVADRLGLGYVIPPGINAENWIDLPKEPRIVTSIDQATILDLQIIESLGNELAARDIMLCRIGADYVPNTWLDYRDFLGRSLIYFAHSSCSERMKAEAMLSGCCVLAHSAAEQATIDGYTTAGQLIVAPEPGKMVELVEELIVNPAKAMRVGQKAKVMARHLYDWDCYSQAWLKYLNLHVWKNQSGSLALKTFGGAPMSVPQEFV